MTQIEQAIAQIAELKAQLPKGTCAAQIAMESLCKDEAYNETIGILKTLLNEQNHANSAKNCKDLQKHIDECWQTWVSSDNNPIANGDLTKEEFDFYARHFAQWQKEQDQKELQIAEEHGILTGMNMEREKMMKDALAVETPFKAEELAKATDTLVYLIWRDLALSQFDSMLGYYMSKFKYYLSKWPFHRYSLIRARKALIKYRKAFHDFEDFKREFGYEVEKGKEEA